MKALAHRIKDNLKIFLYFKKIDFLKRLAYPANFWLFFVSLIISIFFNLFFLKVIFGWVGNLQGWNYFQALLVAGSMLLIDGMMWVCFGYLHDLKNQIHSGTLDFLLTKPKNSQFLISSQRGDLEDILRVIIGMAILFYATKNLGLWRWEMLDNVFWYGVVLLCGLIMLYSLTLMLNCIAFWTIEASMSFFVLESLTRSAQYPTDIFRQVWLRGLFTFAIPLAFLATVPAKVLLFGFGWWVLGAVILAIIFFLLSHWVWKKGLAKYSSASS